VKHIPSFHFILAAIVTSAINPVFYVRRLLLPQIKLVIEEVMMMWYWIFNGGFP